MNTLRAKLVALLAGSILLVVGLATWLNWQTVGRPDFSELIKANAAYIGHLLGRQQDQSASASIAVARHQNAPAGGRLLTHFTSDLRAELIRSGLPAHVVVSLPTETTWPVVSVDVPGQAQKLVFPAVLPPRPPSMPPTALIGWIALIAAGTIAISVAAVYRLTQPLVLVERSVTNVDDGGELPLLPETGPAEVRATARAINRLSARLRQATESRMRLVAAAGHDLRTPMARMRLRAEFLGDSERQKWLADLDELDHIADSAISLVREETTAEEQNPFRLDGLLREVVAELSELGMDLRLGSVAAAEIVVRPLSLKRALRNLLVNAATHGKGATITLFNSGAVARIEILDRGEGIPDHLLERAMEPFFRANPVRSSRGAGLGLAIAREIILRNGGQLTLANARAGGLAQTITMPIHHPVSAAASFGTQRYNGIRASQAIALSQPCLQSMTAQRRK